jgi:hypothetical protein
MSAGCNHWGEASMWLRCGWGIVDGAGGGRRVFGGEKSLRPVSKVSDVFLTELKIVLNKVKVLLQTL